MLKNKTLKTILIIFAAITAIGLMASLFGGSPSGDTGKDGTDAAVCEHDYEIVDNFVSCELGGTKTYTCKLCDEVVTKTLDPREHTDANDDMKCDVCGEEFVVEDENVYLVTLNYTNYSDWLELGANEFELPCYSLGYGEENPEMIYMDGPSVTISVNKDFPYIILGDLPTMSLTFDFDDAENIEPYSDYSYVYYIMNDCVIDIYVSL